jgi:hypothetical protein
MTLLVAVRVSLVPFGWSQDKMASHYSHPELERIRETIDKAMEGLEWKEDVQ